MPTVGRVASISAAYAPGAELHTFRTTSTMCRMGIGGGGGAGGAGRITITEW